jgi:hypothetical protein
LQHSQHYTPSLRCASLGWAGLGDSPSIGGLVAALFTPPIVLSSFSVFLVLGLFIGGKKLASSF